MRPTESRRLTNHSAVLSTGIEKHSIPVMEESRSEHLPRHPLGSEKDARKEDNCASRMLPDAGYRMPNAKYRTLNTKYRITIIIIRIIIIINTN